MCGGLIKGGGRIYEMIAWLVYLVSLGRYTPAYAESLCHCFYFTGCAEHSFEGGLA